MYDQSAADRTVAYYHVAACRECGREYSVRAPVSATAGGSDVHTRCANCGTTNPTAEQVDTTGAGKR